MAELKSRKFFNWIYICYFQRMSAAIIINHFYVLDMDKSSLETILLNHQKSAFFVEVSPTLVTKKNPLDFETRKAMLEHDFPGIQVIGINDIRDKQKWSAKIDQKISELFPGEEIIIYGEKGKPCYYEGIHKYEEVFEFNNLNLDLITYSPETGFRAGMMYAVKRQYPKVNPTVDIAIVKENKILLGRKPHENRFRFIGGFVDPSDKSFEDAAVREAKEETGISVNNLRYIGTFAVDDWRYRDEIDKIITTFFTAECVDNGTAKASDDITELCWIDATALNEDLFVPEHLPLLMKLKDFLRSATEKVVMD